jgi:hypothetical protein
LHPRHRRTPKLQPFALHSLGHLQLLSCSVCILSLSHFGGAVQILWRALGDDLRTISPCFVIT